MLSSRLSLFILQSFPRELGEAQSKVVKIFMGGALVVGLVLLIWGPLLLIGVVNQASIANPPTGVTVRLTLEGFQVSPVLMMGW